MDNDAAVLLWLKGRTKKIYNAVAHPLYLKKISIEETKKKLESAVTSGAPYLVSRLGATESLLLQQWQKNGSFSERDLERGRTLSGIFKENQDHFSRFCEIYSGAISAADLMGVMYSRGEAQSLKKYASSNLEITELRNLEPYYSSDPWSSSLQGKRVLVVHPFKSTILSQYEKRSKLFTTPLLPDFADLTVIAAVQSAAGEMPAFESWEAALQSMLSEIDSHDYDVALVGAGAYGLPLSAHIKKKGKVAIHLGGALQLLFGIKGSRWDSHPVISKLYNEHWVSAHSSERPSGYKLVEGGSYW